MQSPAATVDEYLASLPDARRDALAAVRAVILANLDPLYSEAMAYGMIGYGVPHSVYPDGYHCNPKQPLPFAGLASQKNYMSVYLMGFYVGCSDIEETADMQWFRAAWANAGKKLDMGKACIRFKRVEDLALDVIAKTLRDMPARKYVAEYEEVLASAAERRSKPPARGRKAAAARKSK